MGGDSTVEELEEIRWIFFTKKGFFTQCPQDRGDRGDTNAPKIEEIEEIEEIRIVFFYHKQKVFHTVPPSTRKK